VDRVLNNLVSNAVKYTPSGGRVSVHLHHAQDEACLEVCDTGIGIPPESVPHLFEEFYRAPNAKALEKEGTGLGLAIIKDLVTRYGGRIAVQSELGQGTTFSVTWPATTADHGPHTADGGQ
jgi:signal transduction histidine kinase